MSFWGISAFFNPTHSKTRVENLRRFAAGVREQGLKLLIVELAFGESEVRDQDCDIGIRLHEGAVCWQKERLLNIGRDFLPFDCDQVAWLDTDILFKNRWWVETAKEALKEYSLVQLFRYVQNGIHSDRGIVASRSIEDRESRTVRTFGEPMDAMFGRTGYAWAARREVLDRVGFYDRCIVGGGDAVMAYAGYNRIWPTLDQAPDYFSAPHMLDIAFWIERFHAEVQGNIGFIPGTIVHLDHGSEEGRAYGTRTEILKRHKFTPADVTVAPSGPWLWNSPKAEMHAELAQYFSGRGD